MGFVYSNNTRETAGLILLSRETFCRGFHITFDERSPNFVAFSNSSSNGKFELLRELGNFRIKLVRAQAD